MINHINKPDAKNNYKEGQVCLYFSNAQNGISLLADKFKFNAQNLYETDIKGETIRGHMQTRKVTLPFFIAKNQGELYFENNNSTNDIILLSPQKSKKIS